MKKYIIFFVSWFICTLAGFGLFFLDRSSLSFVALTELWIKTDCIYAILIGYVIAFSIVIGLYLKDKIKHIKPREKETKTGPEEIGGQSGQENMPIEGIA